MHIKQVVIEGFKTYRDRTKIEFEDGFNVIVGPNGAGKTNLLTALQFVLLSEYHAMPQWELQKMINSSTQHQMLPRIFVEVVFDNTERNLTEKTDEVRLSREVTPARDLFLLNGRPISKDQVKSMLHSAGFSKVNSYHVIKQGNATKLALASDSEKLSMLKEAAGCCFWENELRLVSQQKLDEAKVNLKELEKNVEHVEANVDSLQEEHEEYRKWECLKEEISAAEHCLSRLEIAALRRKLEHHEEQCAAKEKIVSLSRKVIEDIQAEEEQANNTIETEKSNLNHLKARLQDFKEILEAVALDQTKLEFEIVERKKKSKQESGKVSLENEIAEIDRKISEKNTEVANLTEELEAAANEECQLGKKLMRSEERQKELFSRSAQTQTFADQQARDAWINARKNVLHNTEAQLAADLRVLESQREKESAELERKKSTLEELEFRKSAEFNKLREAVTRKNRISDELRRNKLQQNEMRRTEMEETEKMRVAAKTLERLKYEFGTVVPKSVRSAIENVSFIIKTMLDEGHGTRPHELARGYRGLVVEQFTYDEVLNTAIDSVAGNRLFDHIVDNEIIANAILDRMEREGLSGDVRFLACQNMRRCDIGPELRDESSPIMNFLTLKTPEIRVAVEQVFGKWLLCENLDAATRISYDHNLNCVTLDGHRVMAKGAINGGFYDRSRLRAPLYKELMVAQADEISRKEKMEATRMQLRKIDVDGTRCLGALQKIETEIEHLQLDEILKEMEKRKEGIDLLEQSIRGKEGQERRMATSINQIQAKIVSLNQQLHQSFTSGLSEEERLEVSTLSEGIATCRDSLKRHEIRRQQLETSKHRLESEIRENLMKRKTALERDLNDIIRSNNNASDDDGVIIKEMEDKLQDLILEQRARSTEIESLERKIAIIIRTLCKEDLNLQKIFSKHCEKERQIVDEYEKLHAIEERIRALKARESVIAETIAKFESSPVNQKTLAKYEKLGRKQLEAKLAATNQKLKKMSAVNTKAHIEYIALREKLEELQKKLQTLEEGHETAQEVIDSVDDQKNEFIQYSLTQIARNFSEIFEEIVNRPGCWGKLRWVYDDTDISEGDDGSEQLQIPDVRRLRGVSLDISFSGNSKVHNIKSLSGGQRSVVSLSLVFAILLMDRAPFYLLDEADMALDSKYRQKTAEMINKLARRSQFIAITFQPEMLQFANNIIKVSYDVASSKSSCEKATVEQAEEFVTSSCASTQGSV